MLISLENLCSHYQVAEIESQTWFLQTVPQSSVPQTLLWKLATALASNLKIILKLLGQVDPTVSHLPFRSFIG